MLSLCPYFFHQNCPFNFVTCETAALQWSLGSVVQENFLVGLIGTTLELQSGELDFSFSTHELTMQISPLFCRLSTVSTRISCMLHLDCQLLPCLLLVQHHSGTLMRSNHLCVKKQYADGLLTSVLQAAVEQSPLATDAQCIMFYRNTAWATFLSAAGRRFFARKPGQGSTVSFRARLTWRLRGWWCLWGKLSATTPALTPGLAGGCSFGTLCFRGMCLSLVVCPLQTLQSLLPGQHLLISSTQL